MKRRDDKLEMNDVGKTGRGTTKGAILAKHVSTQN
jgi:hypothetical protein